MESLKFKEKCIKHPQEKIEYIKISNSQQSQNKPLFCCLKCFNSDSTLNYNEYQRIKQLISIGLNQILQKWPPVKNQEIIDQLIKITSEEYSFDETISKVNSFFKNLKQSINDQIDKNHKECIKYVEDHQFNQKDIVAQYQEISKINDLRSYLLNNQANLQEKEKQCQALIEQSYSLVEKNTSLLQNLKTKNNQKCIFDSESGFIIQQSILESIDKIKLFQEPNPIQKLNLEFSQTQFNDKQKGLQIQFNDNKQQQIKLAESISGYLNGVSNLILESNKKYILRFQVNLQRLYDIVYIGLISDANKNILAGRDEKLCCRLINKGQFIIKEENHGIYKQLKGDEFKLGENKELEMRVCIAEKKVEMLDYPNYNYKIGLDDQYIYKLANAENIRIYLGFAYKNTVVTLTEAIITKYFE